MQKPLDRITQAYFGELGDAFSEKVRSRVHWVCEKAKGETVLDIGCSQGITSILLGREGKKVIGVDLLQESIDYANEVLLNEEESTQKLVEFKAANFILVDFGDQTFDSIILGEVLEHVTDPERFINKAFKLLNDNGSLIITLPFGINDYFDHKKTYYLMDLMNFAYENGVVQEVKFFGKWIGAILKKKGQEKSSVTVNSDLVFKLEESFYSIERDLLTKIAARDKKIKLFDEKIKTLSADLKTQKTTAVEQLKGKNKELEAAKKQLAEDEKKITIFTRKLKEKEAEINNKAAEVKEEEIKSLKAQLQEKEDLISTLQQRETEKNKKLKEYEKHLELTKKEKISVQETLYDAYKKEEKLLQSQQNLLRKYRALSESKLGKITLSYWNRRRKIRGGK
ncbi:methyltransferase domain-containing protein [Neobacillus sp. LXY-1]|uniref:methyltransferase domain-containing protein n=1 Tax=Neobacillus sp. LXY-1 TaxID=3379133 RepID=UPI003EDE8399